MKKFIKKDGFKLNQLQLDFNTWYKKDDIKMLVMYETEDKQIIEHIYNYYLQISKLNISTNINISRTDITKSCFGITSIFWKEPVSNDFVCHISRDELTKIKNVHICAYCYRWFFINNFNIKSKFKEQNPLKYFWFEFVEELHDMIEFESEQDVFIN